MSIVRRAILAVVMSLSLAGCSSSGAPGRPAKADFVTAADHICDSHLQTVFGWLEQFSAGQGWRRLAVRDGGIYDIVARTIGRLEALGPAPGPHADAFAGYVRTLKARAVLYRLTSMADLQRDRSFLRRLGRAIGEIDGVGDAAARRYGLRVCGASLSDLVTRFA